MITEEVWYSGEDEYRKHTLTINSETNINKFHTDILDKEFESGRTFFQIANDSFLNRQTKFVEVLFSGGLDSEMAIHSCLVNNIPVRSLTMRIMDDGVILNVQDLYYAEKFSRENGIKLYYFNLINSSYEKKVKTEYFGTIYYEDVNMVGNHWEMILNPYKLELKIRLLNL